jgi:large subunit ribosomal protein L49
MALPRPATFKHFLGAARASTSAVSSSSTPTAPFSPLSSPPKASSPTTDTPAKPYRITRTTTHNLPVYLLSKRGGNLKQTRIRRIEGNINVLRSDLQAALGVEEKEVMINQLTQQIIVKVCSFSEAAVRRCGTGLMRA